MSRFSHHMEWLSPGRGFRPLSYPCPCWRRCFLKDWMPWKHICGGELGLLYNEWCDAVEEDDAQLPELHRAWIELVLTGNPRIRRLGSFTSE